MSSPERQQEEMPRKQRNRSKNNLHRGASGPTGRRPYEKPMIVFEQKLEALAAVCNVPSIGKAPGTCTYAFS